MENEKIKELEAIIVVLAKQIAELRKKVNGSSSLKSDEAWLRDLKKEAQKIRL